MATSTAHKRENGLFADRAIMRMSGARLSLNARTKALPLYVIDYFSFLGLLDQDAKDNWRRVFGNPDTHTQPTFHRDDGGYLPDLPPDQGHPELHIPNNGLPHPGLLRAVVDIPAQRVFVTPTHYEDWHDGTTERNPFYVLHNAAVPRFGAMWKELLAES